MAAKKETNSGSADFYAIGLIMSLAVLGGVIAQGWVGSSAMAGVARNPGSKSAVQTLMILTLVLIESLVIYALVVSLLLYAKL
ncbi:ATP synthase F0 subunit C [Myxococcota bacterium]|nr:ATP synthase F0 subunit C [Myxococcota bacterium]MBU1410403.1 ATP synthase F0 subunit C [Myxococcota bacterium]